MKKGRCETMTHDYKRHGTTTLFAALNIATGEVIGKTYRKHRHQEVLRFLEKCLRDYLLSYNKNPRPLVWTKTVDEILEKVHRSREALPKTS